MTWFQTPEGTYRYARKGSGRAAMYKERGYKDLGEKTPKDAGKKAQGQREAASSWVDPDEAKPKE